MNFKNFISSILLLFVFSISLKAQKTTIYTIRQLTDYNSALELFDKEKYSAAQDKFEQIYKSTLDKKSEVALNAKYYMALCGLNLFNIDAENLFVEFINDYPDSPKIKQAYFYLGSYQFRAKKYDEALVYFKKIDANDLSKDELAEYKFKVGYSYFSLEKYDEASNYFYEIKDYENTFTSPARYYYGHIAYLQKKYESALQTFLLLNNDEKFSPITPYYISQIYYLQGKYDKVIEYAPALLDTVVPARGAEIARIIGESYYRTNKFREALPYLNRFNKEKAALANRADYYELGYAYFKSDSCENAINWFKKSIEKPDSISQTAHYHLAECYLKLGNKLYAKTSFREAYIQNFDPQIEEDALFNFAKISYELSTHPFNDAIVAFEEYINTYPNSTKLSSAYEYLVGVYYTTKNYEAALKSLENIKVLDNQLQGAYQKIAHFRGLELFNNQKYNEAITFFNKSDEYLIDKNIKIDNIYWRAEAYYSLNDYSKAIGEYKKFIFEPQSTASMNTNKANYNLGYSYFELKEYEEAKTWFRKYAQNAPDENSKIKNDALNRIGDCFFITKNYKGAIEFYDKAAMMNLYQTDYSLFQSAVCNGINGNYNDKISLLNTFVARKEKSHLLDDAYFELGQTYLIQNDNDKALKSFKQLNSEFPNSPYISRAMVKEGLIYFNSKQDNDALAVFKSVVSTYPKTDEAKESLEKIKKIFMDKGDLNAYESYLNTVGGADSSALILDNDYYEVAENDYMDGNCDKAVNEFTKYLEKYPNGTYLVNAHFYKAVCEQKAGFVDEALLSFNKVIEQPKNKFTETAILYAAKINSDLGHLADALNNYNQLEYLADVQENVFKAQIEQMRLNFQLNNFDNAIKYCEIIINKDNGDLKLIAEAHLIYGKCLLTKDDSNLALKEFKIASTATNKFGAESKYQVANILYLRGEYANCEAEVFAMVKKFSAYDYWMEKTLILLGDNYVAKEDFFQAKITLKNVIENSKFPELVSVAQDKLRIIEEQEAAKKLVPKTEELNIDLNSGVNVEKLFTEPEKAVEEVVPVPQEPKQKEEE